MGFTFPYNPFSGPNLLVPLVMFGWIPIVLYLFSRLPAQRAVVLSFLVAWLFLPQAERLIPGLPNYTKTSATCYGIMLATFVFDVGRFSTFRFGWLDIPMAIWCFICPLASSLTNDLGLYDGVAATLDKTMTWGAPYFLGRIYLNTLGGLRQLAVGIFIGGLVYVPLCLFESRFSPQLHRIVYGGHAFADFSQAMRLGGFRPTVFMQHGLAVGAFMMAATLIGIWLWQTNVLKRVWNVPMAWLVAVMFLTFILLRSTGALGLFALGIAILFIAKQFRTALPVYLVIGAIVIYLYINAETRVYFTDQLIGYLSEILPPDRVGSLEFRFNNEELLVDRARERLIFGWGGWGRSRVLLDPYGPQYTVQDSLWIIAFGENGTVGLASLFSAMLMPIVALFGLRYPAWKWTNPKVAPAAVLAIVVMLYMVDCILNAMINPIYILAVGGIAGLVMTPQRSAQEAGVRLSPTPRRALVQSQ
jgi:hypothetical protein